MFLFGVPFVFGAIAVLFGMVAYLRATSRDPMWGGHNLRAVQMSMPFIIIIVAAFVVSTVLEWIDAETVLLHPLWATIGLLITFVVARTFMPERRRALVKQLAQIRKQQEQQQQESQQGQN